MKNLLTYCFIILLNLFFFTNCDDPNPTELFLDDTAVEDDIDDVELTPSKPGTFIYTNGYDSTGIIDPLPRRRSVVFLSGAKYTLNNILQHEINHAEAVFYDRNRPVQTNTGSVVGFHSNYVGRVLFGNDSALVRNNRVSFIENGIQKNVNAGLKYVFSKRVNIETGANKFPFGQRLLFRLVNPATGNNIERFQIPTPEEITGSVQTSGSVDRGNLKIKLQWSSNRNKAGKVKIIIGGVLKNTQLNFPVFDINVRDIGNTNIPKWIIDLIPFERFDSLIVTFIRQLEFVGARNSVSEPRLNDSFIVAQSIHNVIFIP